MGAQERVGFPDFLDEFAPLLGRDPAGLERGHINDLALGRGHGFGVRLFEAQATHLVGVPAVVADELEAFVRDVLGDAGDEVARVEHLKIALDLRVHPRAVNDRVAGAAGLHFLDREWVADDVLREPLHVLAVHRTPGYFAGRLPAVRREERPLRDRAPAPARLPSLDLDPRDPPGTRRTPRLEEAAPPALHPQPGHHGAPARRWPGAAHPKALAPRPRTGPPLSKAAHRLESRFPAPQILRETLTIL